MNEGDVVGDYVNQLELIAKELADAGHTLSDKMQVIVVLNSLPPSWDHIVTSLTHSGKELAMTTLPPKYKFKYKRFKKLWTRKPRQEYKPRDVCYRYGENGHYKINCPLNKRPKNKGKEIAMTITEALVIESPPTSWWVDFVVTRHIARNCELFVDLKEKQLGEHRVYMGNNTYSDVLGEDLENSGRKRTSPKPAMPSIDADDSGRKRQRRPSSMLKDYYLMESKAVAIEDDPANFAKAMESRKPVECKWVLRKKYKADRSLDKYKTRLVAKGFTQQPDLELHQLDVKTAFLNGNLKEEIYMDHLDGFQIKSEEGKVCTLKKSLYGLKQSSRQWYLKFHQVILDIGYEMSPLDHCVYVWRDKEKLALLSLYVDDILLASNSPDMMKETKFYLGSKFEMKDIGPVNYSWELESLEIEIQSKAHWQAVKRIFRYLQMTKSMKLCFGLDELEIKRFTNADFAGDTDDRKSTS
uniref:Reverse transcriptase Ty1/copia-type domain-containing protein n=1 Tax=Fagus sylvatica TaxID=28930 RepID=A0A2N9GG10_FAGSY